MTNQTTNTVFMIRPVSFRLNKETARNNYFQQEEGGINSDEIQARALSEFDLLVSRLQEEEINVIVFEENRSETPDSIFPNNWVSTHEEGMLITYPMYAENRRLERRKDIIEALKSQFEVKGTQELEHWENREKYLEGTGSMVLDRQHKVAYASISARTDIDVLQSFCALVGYEAVAFTSFQTVDDQRLPIYHTNVMMAIGNDYAIICSDCIDNIEERECVKNSLEKTGKQIIEISEVQMAQFAGNTLEIQDENGASVTVMSEAAFRAFNDAQLRKLEHFGKIIQSPIPTIERLGGGSVRCMIAEIFLEKK